MTRKIIATSSTSHNSDIPIINRISTLNQKIFIEMLQKIPDNIGGYKCEWSVIAGPIWGCINIVGARHNTIVGGEGKLHRPMEYFITMRHYPASKFLLRYNYVPSEEVRIIHKEDCYVIKSFTESQNKAFLILKTELTQ